MMYIFFKQNKYPPVSITESQIYGLREMKKGGKEKKFTHSNREYYFSEIAFIGEKCHNEKCHRLEYNAHPLGEECDYSFTGACVDCGKQMWKRDVDYAVYKWKKIVCRLHSPFGTPPISERYDLSDPKQKEEAVSVAFAEGYALGSGKQITEKPGNEQEAIQAARAAIEEQNKFLEENSLADIPF